MTDLLKRLVADDHGATAIEYALIASLMSLAAVIGMSALGVSLQEMFGFIGSQVEEGLDKAGLL